MPQMMPLLWFFIMNFSFLILTITYIKLFWLPLPYFLPLTQNVNIENKILYI